eukprot:COSAG01_NODE_17290_length_1163_cov_1.126880_2_plen_259_part_01
MVGRPGPAAQVTQAQIAMLRIRIKLLEEQLTTAEQELPDRPIKGHATGSVCAAPASEARTQGHTERPSPILATVTHEFAASVEGDLSLAVGERIILTKAEECKQWWCGYREGDRSAWGIFPKMYVRRLEGAGGPLAAPERRLGDEQDLRDGIFLSHTSARSEGSDVEADTCDDEPSDSDSETLSDKIGRAKLLVNEDAAESVAEAQQLCREVAEGLQDKMDTVLANPRQQATGVVESVVAAQGLYREMITDRVRETARA